MKRPARLMQHKPLKRSPLSTTSGDTGQAPKTAQRPIRRRRRRGSGPTPDVRRAVLERDDHRCVRCGIDVRSVPDYSLQHRRARGMGGTARADSNSPANLVVLCGSATTGCHGHVESHRHEAIGDGWAIPLSASTPADWPVLTRDRGRILLDDDGGWRHA